MVSEDRFPIDPQSPMGHWQPLHTPESLIDVLKQATLDQLRSIRDMLGIVEPSGFVAGQRSGLHRDGKWIPESEFSGEDHSSRTVTAQDIIAALRKASPEELISIRRLLTAGPVKGRLIGVDKTELDEEETREFLEFVEASRKRVGPRQTVQLLPHREDPETERWLKFLDRLDWIDGIDWSNS